MQTLCLALILLAAFTLNFTLLWARQRRIRSRSDRISRQLERDLEVRRRNGH